MKIRPFILVGFFAALSFAAARPSTTSLANLSTRGLVGPHAGDLVAGFVVTGTANKTVLLRGVGPGLAEFGLTNAATAVAVNLYDSAGRLIAANNGYQNSADAELIATKATQVGAFPLTNPGDSALVVSLMPGAYSLTATPGPDNTDDGAALLEVYDANSSYAGGKIVNLSTRGRLGDTAGPIVSGFVVRGHGAKNVLIRAIGPDLAFFGLADAAAGVDLNVFDSSGNLVATNSGYLNSALPKRVVQLSAQVGAFPLGSPGDSAVAVRLPPGVYTISASPSVLEPTGGACLVEVYDAGDADLDAH